MKRLVLAIFAASLLLAASSAHAAVRFAAGGLSMGLGIGYSPDIYYLSDRGEQLANQNTRILNRMAEINELYDSSAYGEKKVLRDYRFNSNSIGAVPVEISLKYSWYGILFRMGFVYYNAPVDQRSYVLTTGSATSRKYRSTDGSSSLYEDLNNNKDRDTSNDEALAVGLRPTYGQPVRFVQFLKVSRFEMPVTFGISMFNLGPASFFFGGGMTFYWGSKTRVIHAEAENGSLANQELYIDDVDKFTTRSIGFHIMMGGEYRIVKDVGITMDVTLNFGGTGPITDSVQTGAFTNDSLFHGNDGGDFGGTEDPDGVTKEKTTPAKEGDTTPGADAVQIGHGLERTDSFDFSGLRLMVGVNYHIARNPTPRKK